MSKIEKYSAKIKNAYGDDVLDRFKNVDDYRILKKFYISGGNCDDITKKGFFSKKNVILSRNHQQDFQKSY